MANKRRGRKDQIIRLLKDENAELQKKMLSLAVEHSKEKLKLNTDHAKDRLLLGKEHEENVSFYKWSFIKAEDENKKLSRASLDIQADLDKALNRMRDYDQLALSIRNIMKTTT